MTNSPIPTRHPETPGAVPVGIRLIAGALGIDKPSPQRWHQIGVDLTVGDEPMRRLVDWMSATGTAATRPIFDEILTHGLAAVPDAPEPLREFFGEFEPIPEWVDMDLLRRGQRALRRGGADGVYISRDVSLLGGYRFSSFNKTLLRTGVLEKGSNKRFAETMQWALDLTAEGGLEPLGVGYRATVRVRLIHEYVRRHVAALPDWRGDEWGLPVNQTDMAATLVGALIAPPIGGLGIGIVLPPGELDAIAHLTRYVGWLMGVRDEWLPRSYRDAVRILYHTLGALSAPDESTKQLAVPMADDPLQWHYSTMTGLRRRVARAQHLSLTSGFLGPRAMRELGLPAYVPPWYQVLRTPINLVRSTAALVLPGGLDRAALRGRREQEAFMRTMMGAGDTTIGASAHVMRVA
ncbi:oxygenase MpaB family protein [Mycolicibacter sp. MYC123]|uniref:Oxygenase MpaB family protein n=1 Tax=[Mycobacterium] zoologicum TaxID=2872311 RepID=A0ABU5YNI7_9MYCO|nr:MULTISPECIES: oxygenase MpaB family protein [unclassified Mycolicibacter]MEB3051621.1 oxygenase MpaB family protein [Mycolicibacter sp. MYC123]MEB3064572.1 oxygenase MpaB family protein [Mycolicibacter sp. MYC101]